MVLALIPSFAAPLARTDFTPQHLPFLVLPVVDSGESNPSASACAVPSEKRAGLDTCYTRQSGNRRRLIPGYSAQSTYLVGVDPIAMPAIRQPVR